MDLRASAYRKESDSTSEWRGESHSRKDTDNSNFNAAVRFKFIGTKAGGLSGTLGGGYNDGERHGYYAELAPYFNLSRTMTGLVITGYGNDKTAPTCPTRSGNTSMPTCTGSQHTIS